MERVGALSRWIRISVAALIALASASCSSGPRADNPSHNWHMRTFFREDGWTFRYVLPSPDGRHIAFLGSDINGPIGDQVGLIEGRGVRQISLSRYWALDFAWMPNSKALLIAYGNVPGADRLAEFDLSGHIIRRIPVRKRFMCNEAGMTISSDGKRAIIAAQHPSASQEPIYLQWVNLRTGAVTYLPGKPIGGDPNILSSDKVAFVGQTGIDIAVMVLDLGTGRARWITPLTQTVDSLGAGHPHGVLIYGLLSDDPHPGIWLTGIEHGPPVQVHAGADLVDPVLLPSGNAALAVDVGAVGADTEPIVELTPAK